MTNVYGLASLDVAIGFAKELQKLEANYAVNLYSMGGEIRFDLLTDPDAPQFALGDQQEDAYYRSLGIV